MNSITGAAAIALDSLSESQTKFLQTLSKAELHAHLNGSIPLSCLQQLAQERGTEPEGLPEAVSKGLQILERGVELETIEDFFTLFPAIYSLTSSPRALTIVTREVLSQFLLPGTDGSPAQCEFIELRTTPRATSYMTRKEYLIAVLDVIDTFGNDKAALLVSVDRRMAAEDIEECVDLAISLKNQGRSVVGLDLCGDPTKGEVSAFLPAFFRAKAAGLGITVHIAETLQNTEEDTQTLLSLGPSRLGHATFLSPAAREIVLREKMPIEICLTSNLLCKTVKTVEAHHIRYFLKRNHPIAICTDDTLPFRTSLLGEYALLMAVPPLGLGLGENEIARIAQMGRSSSFVNS